MNEEWCPVEFMVTQEWKVRPNGNELGTVAY
jgi:hypothetical protein